MASPVALWPNAFIESWGRHEEAAFVDRRLTLLIVSQEGHPSCKKLNLGMFEVVDSQ